MRTTPPVAKGHVPTGLIQLQGRGQDRGMFPQGSYRYREGDRDSNMDGNRAVCRDLILDR